ncbi:MAG: ABC transporter ATP-binding protein [Clostridia bacterium]|nr:ABC transporter ATP-binding protein [Clostridia bacterium]
MIDIKNVTKNFGSFTAIQDLSFHVDDGMIYGLVGYNGAGKTTLLKSAADVYRPEEGEILIDGENVKDNAKAKQKIFYVPDDLYFLPYSNMEKMAKFYSGYYPHFSFDTFRKLSKLFGLDIKKRLNGFSKGMQRQAELILALSAHPTILLLDESFDGLDPQKRNVVKDLVGEYVKETGTSVIISSHNLHELSGISDRIGLINGKRLALDCGPGEASGSHSKIRVVFPLDFSEDVLLNIEHKKLVKDGKIMTFCSNEPLERIRQKLEDFKPLLLEEFPLTLEERFMEEMEGAEYDFAEIFKV